MKKNLIFNTTAFILFFYLKKIQRLTTLLYPIVFALAFFSHGSLNGQVVYNNDVVVGSFGGNATETLPNFQIIAGTNRLLVVSVSWTAGGGTNVIIDSITYDGINLTQATTTNLINIFHQSIWYLPIGTGATTSGDIVVNMSSASGSFVIAASTFQHVHQTTSIGNTNATNSISGTSSILNINSGNTNNLIVDAIASNGNLASAQTLIFQYSSTWGASYQSANIGANNMTWTFNSGYFIHVGAEINHDGVTFLPVELTLFKGESKDHKNQLTWQTASELNNKGFEIEKSTDGQHWETIGFLEGKGSATVTNDYSFTDERPFRGQNYYRLKQLDFDGQFEYSKVVSIKYRTENFDYRIFPNPVSDVLTIEISEPADIQIFNQIGQLVLEKSLTETEQIDISHLKNGMYWIKINQLFNQVIIKN